MGSQKMRLASVASVLRTSKTGTYILAAVMLDSWALRPVCRSPLAVSVDSCASAWRCFGKLSTRASWWGGPTYS